MAKIYLNDQGQASFFNPNTSAYEWVPQENINKALAAGLEPEDKETFLNRQDTNRYNSLTSPLESAGLGMLSAATFGLSDLIVSKAGGQEYLQKLYGNNPVGQVAGEIAGFLNPYAPANMAINAGIKGAGKLGKRLLSDWVETEIVRGAGSGAASAASATAKEALVKDTVKDLVPPRAGAAFEPRISSSQIPSEVRMSSGLSDTIPSPAPEFTTVKVPNIEAEVKQQYQQALGVADTLPASRAVVPEALADTLPSPVGIRPQVSPSAQARQFQDALARPVTDIPISVDSAEFRAARPSTDIPISVDIDGLSTGRRLAPVDLGSAAKLSPAEAAKLSLPEVPGPVAVKEARGPFGAEYGSSNRTLLGEENIRIDNINGIKNYIGQLRGGEEWYRFHIHAVKGHGEGLVRRALNLGEQHPEFGSLMADGARELEISQGYRFQNAAVLERKLKLEEQFVQVVQKEGFSPEIARKAVAESLWGEGTEAAQLQQRLLAKIEVAKQDIYKQAQFPLLRVLTKEKITAIGKEIKSLTKQLEDAGFPRAAMEIQPIMPVDAARALGAAFGSSSSERGAVLVPNALLSWIEKVVGKGKNKLVDKVLESTDGVSKEELTKALEFIKKDVLEGLEKKTVAGKRIAPPPLAVGNAPKPGRVFYGGYGDELLEGPPIWSRSVLDNIAESEAKLAGKPVANIGEDIKKALGSMGPVEADAWVQKLARNLDDVVLDDSAYLGRSKTYLDTGQRKIAADISEEIAKGSGKLPPRGEGGFIDPLAPKIQPSLLDRLTAEPSGSITNPTVTIDGKRFELWSPLPNTTKGKIIKGAKIVGEGTVFGAGAGLQGAVTNMSLDDKEYSASDIAKNIAKEAITGALVGAGGTLLFKGLGVGVDKLGKGTSKLSEKYLGTESDGVLNKLKEAEESFKAKVYGREQFTKQVGDIYTQLEKDPEFKRLLSEYFDTQKKLFNREQELNYLRKNVDASIEPDPRTVLGQAPVDYQLSSKVLRDNIAQKIESLATDIDKADFPALNANLMDVFRLKEQIIPHYKSMLLEQTGASLQRSLNWILKIGGIGGGALALPGLVSGTTDPSSVLQYAAYFGAAYLLLPSIARRLVKKSPAYRWNAGGLPEELKPSIFTKPAAVVPAVLTTNNYDSYHLKLKSSPPEMQVQEMTDKIYVGMDQTPQNLQFALRAATITATRNDILKEKFPTMPSSYEISKYNRYHDAVTNPQHIISRILHDTATPEDVEVLQRLVPEQFVKIQEELRKEDISTVSPARKRTIQLITGLSPEQLNLGKMLNLKNKQ